MCVACLGLLQVIGCNLVLGIEEPTLCSPGEERCPTLDGGLDASDDAQAQDDADLDDDASVDDGGEPMPVGEPHAWAQWPMPNPGATGLPNAHSYAVIAQGVVLDAVTQLHWQRVASDSALSWQDATEYCAALSLDGGGFRLPSRIELLSLVDVTQAAVMIDAVAFPDTPADAYWSASRAAQASDQRWAVAFGFTTHLVFQEAATVAHRVRCVRSQHVDQGAPGGTRPDFMVQADTVHDMSTGLTWQRATTAEHMTFEQAKARCASIALAGAAWRLPTIKELHTLVDVSRAHPALTTQVFAGSTLDFHWTGSTLPSFDTMVWTVGFDAGLDTFRASTTTALVRCVR